MTQTSQIIIALGSNVGNSIQTIQQAADRIGKLPNTSIEQLSSIYISEPAFNENQASFYNAVLVAQTTLTPKELLYELQALEIEFGRIRNADAPAANSPRTLDLDIIDYQGEVLSTPELTLPHPGALERDFVVTPLLEIAPNAVLANAKVVNRNNIKYGKVVARCGDGAGGTEGDGAGVPLGFVGHLPRPPVPPSPVLSKTDPGVASETQDGTYGKLSICATPIGNIKDITLRVLDTLKDADLIYSEDTRVTRKLLSYYDIHTFLGRADEYTLPKITPQIIQQLKQGQNIAYTTDAGMPGISDPGLPLINAVRSAGLTVEVLPGASALTGALVASGFEAHNSYFGGFLPRKAGKIAQALQDLASLTDTILVFYESVHRTHKSLAIIAEIFPDREVAMVRELTKLHEEVLRGSATEVAADVAQRIQAGRPLKGEVVILIGSAKM